MDSFMSTDFLKLSELVQQIEGVLNNAFANQYFWVVAEISGHKYYPNNDRHYFDLIEKVPNSNTG
jgi:exodeoxyribonuclease VII large subunit